MIVHVAVTGMQVHAIQNGSNVFPGWSLILIMYTVDACYLIDEKYYHHLHPDCRRVGNAWSANSNQVAIWYNVVNYINTK